MPDRGARAPKYDILAIDLDGTLLDPTGAISPRNRRALDQARAAGIRVVVCTGRGLRECREILDAAGQSEPVVVAGGSIIACPARNRTLRRFGLARDVVHRAARRVLEHEFPVLVLKDPSETGYDYLVVRGAARYRIDPVTEWWFEKMACQVREAAHIEDDEHPEQTVRVGACGFADRIAGVKRAIEADLGGRAAIHHFPAVVAPHHVRTTPEGHTLDVLEVFDGEANKWTAVKSLASEWGVPEGRIAAIGDEINDLPMVRGAGLGVAMGNAVPAVSTAAAKRTASNAEDGVAEAIGRILAGEW